MLHQNKPLLSSALLTAHNLRILPETVQNLVGDLIQVVEARAKGAFDMAALGREKGLKGLLASVDYSCQGSAIGELLITQLTPHILVAQKPHPLHQQPQICSIDLELGQIQQT